jgi:alpha-tubulin suppressor-like RCC1 family protein
MVRKYLSLLFVQTALFISTGYSQDNFIETKEFAIGNNHACASTSAGIKCWGEAEQTTLKAPLDFTSNPRSLSAGNRFTCMIVDEGVKCWGDIPDTSKKEILIENKDLNQPKLLSVGQGHACAVSMEGKIKCWGENLFGETRPPEGLENVTEISVGMNNSCAIANGKVVCWGLYTTGSTEVPEGLTNPRNLTSGWWHHCVATDDGIKCWGNPYKKETPAEVKSLTNFVSGDFYNCAVVPEGVKCWDQKGKVSLVEESAGAYKVGIGTGIACALSPIKGMFCWKLYGTDSYKVMKSYVPSGGIKEIKYIAAGNNSTCVYGDNGKMKCWGTNPFGSTTVPDVIPGPVSSISHGSRRTCSVANAQLSCWGDKDTYYDTPQNLGNISYISVGEYHVCAASPDKVKCWGENMGGVFEVPKTVTNISNLQSGSFHSCAVANNQVVCWGGKTYVVGVNPPEPIIFPRALCAGQFFSCALDAGGDVKCWGEHDTTPEPTPEGGDEPPGFTKARSFTKSDGMNFASNFNYAPSTVKNASELVCGTAHACAVYEGKVKCWSSDGENLKVPEMINPRQISAGANHTCAITDNGLKCWGGMFNIDMPDFSLSK